EGVSCIGIDGAIAAGIADIGEISVAVVDRRYEVVKVLGNVFAAPILEPEEEGVILPDWASHAIAEVMLLVSGFGSAGDIEVVVRVEGFVARELPERSVEGVGS